MLVIVGYFVVIAAVFGGYALVGGHLGALFQPAELFMIAGSGVGAFIVSNNGKSIKLTLRSLPQLFRKSKYNKALYMDLMALMFRLMAKARQHGMLVLEFDIDSPKESPIFKLYPRLLADKQLVDFITDYLRLMIGGNMNAFEIEALMDEEIETYEHECEIPANSIGQIGDGLPAFGIVAAVMGVVHALGAADRSAAELGALIGQAMVGTFLGILLAYGFVTPLSSLLRQKKDESVKMMQCIKITLLSSIHGYAPQIAVEFGRKTLFSAERPSFTELEAHVKLAREPVKQPVEEDA